MRLSNVLRVGFVLATALILMISLTVPSSVKSAGAIDFVAYPRLEVTQGVQNMQTAASGKSVPLIAGKRTYVMFYATSGKLHDTSAILRVDRNGQTMLLNPISKGLVTVGPILPARAKGGIGRFVFELPSNQLSGTVKLKGLVNPYKQYPTDETDMTNNGSETVVTFVTAATVTLDVWDVQYKRLTGSRVYKLADLAPTDHRALMVDWVWRAYPMSTIKWWKHGIYMGRWANISGNLYGYCVATNWAVYHDGSFPSNTYGYGMVTTTGGYMRGCADPFHGVTASGPTYNTSGGGSSGDDYGGHELGHLFGRDHAAFCGAGAPKSSYPYPNGSISPVESDQVGYADAIVGYDIISRNTYNYTWHDVMTYCPDRWPSDISYKKFLQKVQTGLAATAQAPAASMQAPAASVAMDRLMVRGVIDPATNQVEIRPSFVLTDTVESARHQPGPYTFVMRDRDGAEIERYPFTPSVETAVDQGPTAPDPVSALPIDPVAPMFFHELLPYHPETTRIDLVGPDNKQLSSISAGGTAPTVTMLTANSPSRVAPDQQELVVNWTGADADGDQLHYLLEYSNDDGQNWIQYTDAITETEVTLPQENLMAGRRVWLRVSATDGIHTTADSNDSPITVFNHAPTVRIIPPISEALAAPVADPNASTSMRDNTFAVTQTVTLQAEGYDVDLGSLDQELTWSSNLAGLLHRGQTLSTSELGVGQHTITVAADDGSGGTATAQIVITIVPRMEDLPANPDRLMVASDGLMLQPTSIPTTTLIVYNQNSGRVLNWNATVDQPWLGLSVSSGTTPAMFSLALKPDIALAAGTYTATVTFTSPEVPAQRESRLVNLTVTDHKVYLPLVAR